MAPPNAQAGDKPRLSIGLVIAGTLFMVFWVTLHYVIYIVCFAGGMVGDLFLTIFRGTQLPGTMNESRPMFAWGPFLQAALILSGLSGVAAGFAIFLRDCRGRLLLIAATLFVLSLPLACCAIWVLLKTSLLP